MVPEHKTNEEFALRLHDRPVHMHKDDCEFRIDCVPKRVLDLLGGFECGDWKVKCDGALFDVNSRVGASESHNSEQ